MKRVLASLLIWLALLSPAAAGTPEDLTLLGVGAGSDAAPSASYLVQEDGTSKFLLEGTAATIAFDATTTSSTTSSGPCTFSHTATGTDRVAIAGAAWRGTGSVSSATYGGTGMTLVGTATDSGNNTKMALYSFVAPPTSSTTVTFTMTGTLQGPRCGVITFTGVDQTTPTASFASANASSGNPSVNVTSATNEVVVDVVAVDRGAPTVGAGQTQRWNGDNSGNGDVWGASSHEAGAATVTMSWTNGGTDGWAIGAATLKRSIVATTDAILLE